MQLTRGEECSLSLPLSSNAGNGDIKLLTDLNARGLLLLARTPILGIIIACTDSMVEIIFAPTDSNGGDYYCAH